MRISNKRFSDLDVAASVFRAIAAKRLNMKLRPVGNEIGGEALYHECHIEVVDEDEQILPESTFRPVLERLRVTQSFDQFTLWLVLCALAEHPGRTLSVKVSELSATQGKWLATLSRGLSYRSHVADRLIIELADSWTCASTSDRYRIADEIRSLGCRIAVRGTGNADTPTSRSDAFASGTLRLDPFSHASANWQSFDGFREVLASQVQGRTLGPRA